MSKRPFTALVDNSVSRFAMTARPSHRTMAGPMNSTVTVLGVQGKPRRPALERWLQDQIDAIPTVGRLTKEGGLTLCLSPELELEGIKGAMFGEGALPGDALSGIEFRRVPSPIERSKLQQMDLNAYVGKEKLIEFCQWLLDLSASSVERLSRLPKLDDFESLNVRGIARFRELCRGLSHEHYADAFHLWTAEVNNLDCYLVIDQKFVNALTQTTRASLIVKPLAPSELLDEMGVTDREPLPIPPREWRPLF